MDAAGRDWRFVAVCVALVIVGSPIWVGFLAAVADLIYYTLTGHDFGAFKAWHHPRKG